MGDQVERLNWVDIEDMARWISAIPFEEWPQQTRLEDGQIRPAMVNDPRWHGFGAKAADVVFQVRADMERLRGGRFGRWSRLANRMLSVVMPGASIESHADQQEPEWLTRIHVPLLTNPSAYFTFEGEEVNLHLEAGEAYMVDVTRVHGVRNNGPTPRVHFMFDVFVGA